MDSAIKITIPIIIPQKMKYLGANPAKRSQDLYAKN